MGLKRLTKGQPVIIEKAETIGMNGKKGTFDSYSCGGYAIRVEVPVISELGYPSGTKPIVVWCEDVQKIKTN